MEHWFDYVQVSYELIVESEKKLNFSLDHEVEAYVVHLFAKNMNRTDIGNDSVSIQILNAYHNRKEMGKVADDCLLIHSYPFKKNKWPSPTFYKDMGIIAYGLDGNELMENNFTAASVVLNAVFKKL